MPFRFKNISELASESERIATEQIDRAFGELDDKSLDRHGTVHQMRKRCKKLRGLLRLVRPAIGGKFKKENLRFRDAARLVSDTRDAQVMIDTYDSIMDAFADEVDRSSFAPLRGKLTLRLNALAENEAALDQALADFRQRLEKGRDRVSKWSSQVVDLSDLLDGMEKTYGRGRDAMRSAYSEPSAERFHEWRKRVKYHWYHCRLLREIWPAMMKARASETKRLSDILGDAHDLAVFRELLESDPDLCVTAERRQAAFALADRRREMLRQEAGSLGLRLFASKPGTLRKQFKRFAKA